MLFLLFGLIVLLFSIPAVQTHIAKNATDRINEKYGTEIHLERVGLKWNGDVLVKGTLIRDHKNDTMIYVRELATSIYSVKKVLDSDLDLGDISLEGARFYLTKYEGDTSDNLTIFSRKFASNNSQGNTNFLLASDDVLITDGRFMYINEELNDPFVLDYQNLTTEWEDFVINNQTVDAHITSLSFDAIKGYQIRTLDGIFHYDPDLISLNDFSLTTDDSSLEGDITLDTSDGALDDFNTLVEVKAAFAKAEISTNDIRPFYNDIAPDVTLSIQGDLSGYLNDFRVPNLEVRGLGNSIIRGDVFFENLLDSKKFRISGDYKSVQTNYFDLKKLLPKPLETLPTEMTQLGTIRFAGKNSLTRATVVTEGVIGTDLGTVNLDLAMTGLQDAENAGYEGTVMVDDFNLGKLLNDD
ncbi:MAG: translocation/assembly module TamB, partial [Dokdonia donghaensis]|nr:translocation/assembly module TamB [Dokdonia donghaensis]